MLSWSWPLGRGVMFISEADEGKGKVGACPTLGFAFGEDFDGGEGGGGAAFDTHFLEADSEVLFGGFFAHFEDGGGFGEAGLHGGEEVVADDRLGEVVVGAEVHAGADVGAVAFGGEKDEGGGGEGVFFTEGLDDTVAVEFGHHDVAEDEVWLFLVSDFDADAAIFGSAGVVTFEFKHEGDVAAHGGLVFDDENF